MVKEYPENFFGYVDELFAPDFVGAGCVYLGDEVEWFRFLRRCWVTEV